MKRILVYSFACLALIPHLFSQPEEPILRFNRDMHTAKISRISTDAEGKYVLTASLDKTAKLWDANTGEFIRTFRPPIGYGNEGMVYAAALSPDARWAAIGGWSKDNDIYIFEVNSGLLYTRIQGLSNVIRDLEFSPDNQVLVASLGGANGIRVYRNASFELINKDEDYGNNSYNISFSARGQLASVCYDGFLRLYNSDFELIKKKKLLGGTQPFSLDFSPDARLIAVGYSDSPTLQVLDAKSLDLLYEPELGDAHTRDQGLDILLFSQNGSRLFAGGFYRKYTEGRWFRYLRIYENYGKGSYQDFPMTANTIMDLKMLKNRNVVFAGFYPDWGIFHPLSGERIHYHKSQVFNFASNDRTHFKVNVDGFNLGFKPLYENSLSFELITRKITAQTSIHPAYTDQRGGIHLSDWKDTYSPNLNGKNLFFLEENERSRSVDISRDGEHIVIGANWHIYGLNAQGAKRWKTPTQSVPWAVNISGNRQVVAALLGDGTVRWYRMSDGKLLLTLFIHPDRRRWILWTPSGYYDAAPGAEDLLGWHVNQGLDREALMYPISKFRDTYYRPDVIDRILDTQDEAEALRKANEQARKFNRPISSPKDILSKLPPKVRILSPASGSQIHKNVVEVSFSLQSPNEEEITGIKVLLNGRPVDVDRGIKPAGYREKVLVKVPSEDCTVSIIAENRFGTSEAAKVFLRWAGPSGIRPDLAKPTLYLVAIGVSDYDQNDYDLEFAAKDARDFSNIMSQQRGLLYEKVETKLLTDKEATRDNILDALDWLERETTQHDVAMIFFSGHGKENNQGIFYYLPVGVDDTRLKRTGIMREEIKVTVSSIAGKVLVFMDACHSGGLMLASNSNTKGGSDINRIINELIDAENGAVVFSSSTGRQSSYENPAWNNGAFTKALVEGLSGKARYGTEAKVSCKSLDLYITQRVKELTSGQQSPTTNFPPDVEDFPIVILK